MQFCRVCAYTFQTNHLFLRCIFVLSIRIILYFVLCCTLLGPMQVNKESHLSYIVIDVGTQECPS